MQRHCANLGRATEGILQMFNVIMTGTAVYGQTSGASVSIAVGLILLLVVRFHWIWFLWLLLIPAALVVVMGIFMAHNVLRNVRDSFDQEHIVRRLRWVQ